MAVLFTHKIVRGDAVVSWCHSREEAEISKRTLEAENNETT